MAIPIPIAELPDGFQWSDGSVTPKTNFKPETQSIIRSKLAAQNNSIADMANGASLPVPPPTVSMPPAPGAPLDPIKMRPPLLGQASPGVVPPQPPTTVSNESNSNVAPGGGGSDPGKTTTPPMAMSTESHTSFTSGVKIPEQLKIDSKNADAAKLRSIESDAKVKEDVWKEQQPSQSQLHKDLTDIDASSQIKKQANLDEQAQAQKDYNAAVQKFSQMKTDPNRFWASKSTGERVGLTIAAALGTFGSALSHSQNTAMDIINKAIDRDVESQRDEIMNAREGVNLKNNLVAQLRAQGLTLDQATLAAKQVKRDHAAREAEEIANAHGGEAIKANAAKLRAEAEQSNAKDATQVAIATSPRTTQTMQNSVKPDATAAKQAETYVNGYGNAPDVDTAKKVRDAVATQRTLEQGIRGLIDYRDKNGVAVNPWGDNQRVGTEKASAIKFKLKELWKMGALSDGEYARLDSIVPQPGQIKDPRPVYQELLKGVLADSSTQINTMMNKDGVSFTPAK